MTVGRVVRYVFTVSFESCIWWHVLWANFALGHTIRAFTSAEDAIVCRGAYTSCVCHADGWYTECTQPYHEQYGRDGLFVACRHACAAAGSDILVLLCRTDK